MIIKIHHFSYYQLKEIVEHRHDHWYCIKNVFEIVLLSTSAVRIIFGLISYVSEENLIKYWQIDPFSNYFIRSYDRLCQQYLLFGLILSILGIFGKIKFFFSKVDTITFTTPYELIVHNFDEFQQCILKTQSSNNNDQTFDYYPNSLANILIRSFNYAQRVLKKQIAIFSIKIDPNELKKLHKLNIKNRFRPEDRIKMIKILSIIDLVIIVLHIGLVIVCVLGYIDYYHLNTENNACINNEFVILIDIFVMNYNIFTIIQCGILFSSISMSTGIFFKIGLNRLNNQLQRVSIISRKRNLTAIISHESVRPLLYIQLDCLDWMYHQHAYACLERLYSYKEIWSNALFNYLLISIPLNVCAVSGLMIEQLTIGEKMVLYTIIFMHTAMTHVSLFHHSRQTKLLHRFGHYLFPIIQSIVVISKPPRNFQSIMIRTLRIKLKYSDLFNRLLYGPKYGPYVSLIGVITEMFIFNLAVTYVGGFIFVYTHLVLNF